MTTADEILDNLGVGGNTGNDPGDYFHKKEGLLAAKLAADVAEMGPVAEGVDDIMWSYRRGVWSPDRHVVRNRTAQLLANRYRRQHGANAEDIIRSVSPTITCEPVEQYINFTNGLLDWRTGERREHSPEVMSTVQMGVAYAPTATCPEFEAFLASVIPDDMIETVWELIGYLMYSGNPLHKAVMLMGHGRNGKGTFLRVVNAILGERNVTSVSLHDLVGTRFSTVSLFGKIANIAGDIDAGYLESTATLKAITGEDMISAEHKGRDRFDFTPWAVPVFSANRVPASADVTTGYLSRWLVIPFPYSFFGREDRTLDARLHTDGELQGVAAKAIEALRTLMERGNFPTTQSGTAAKEKFDRDVDQVKTWAADCAEVDPDLPWVPRTDLYDAYKRWAYRDNYKPVRSTEFYARLESINGVRPSRRGGEGRGFSGIRVTDQAERWPDR